MRKKRLLALMVVTLLVVFMLSMALVACKPKPTEETPSGEPPIQSGAPSPSGNQPPVNDPSSGNNPPPPPPYEPPAETPVIPSYATDIMKAVEYMVASAPSEYLSLNFGGVLVVKGKRYTMSVKGNVSEDDIEVSTVFKLEGSDKLAFAFYIINSKLFVQLEDGSIFNVAEIDSRYLVSIVDKLPDKISQLIGDLLDDKIASIIPTALEILLDGMTPSSEKKYEEKDGVEKLEFGLDIQGLTDTISGIVAPNGLIGIVAPDLDLSFISELLAMIPPMNGVLKATVDNKILTEFQLELYDNDPESENYKQTMIGFDSAVTFSSTALKLDIPDEIKNYEVLTLGNLNADFTLDIDTHGEAFDIGKLIDRFLPMIDKSLPASMFGEGVLVLRGDSDYSLDIKVSLDPNLDNLDIDNNFINIVLRAGENEIVRVNYLDGKIYVKALANGINGFADGGINMAIPLDLKGYINQLVELVTNAIDGFLGTQFRPEETAAILTASINEGGEVILTPSIQNVITSILKLVGFEDYIEMTGDKITVAIDKDLFDKIFELAKIDPIDLPIFGEVVVGLFNGGIEYLEVTAMDILTLRADNFLLGKSKISREYVEESVGDTENYGENIESVILNFALSLLSDLELSVDIDLSTIDATVNMTPVINSIMAVANSNTYLKFPIALDLSKYDGIFKLRIASNYDSATRDGRILLELITPDGDALISAYNENSNTYIDLTELGLMKFCLTNVNLFQLIRGLLGAEIVVDDFIEVAPEMAMSSFTSGVEIDSNYLGVAVNSYFVTLVTRMLAMDLGIDVDLKAYLNFDGSINMNLGLGKAAELGLKMSLGKESETEYRIADVINGLPKNEYGEYNAFDAEVLVDSILVAERLNFTIDLYEQNIDNTDHGNQTRIVLRNARATKDAPEVLANGMEAPYKSMVLTIYKAWSDSSAAIAYGVINFDAGKIQLKIAQGALEGIKLNSILSVIPIEGIISGILSGLDIPIDVDLRKTLIDALSGLFGSSSDDGDGNYGGVIEVPDGALPAHKPHRCKHVCSMCGKCTDENCLYSECKEKCAGHCEHACPTCGLCTNADSAAEICASKCATNGVHEETPSSGADEDSGLSIEIDQLLKKVVVSLTATDLDVDVSLNGAYFSKMIKDLLQGVFTNLDLSSMGVSGGPITLNYDNQNTPNAFANELYEKVIKKIVEAKATGLAAGALGMTNAQDLIVSLVNRFLPLPNVQDLDVNISLMDGKIANITAIGKNDADADVDGEKYRTNLGFGIYIFNHRTKTDDAISWEGQDRDIYFNPTLGGNLEDMFVKEARKHVSNNWEETSKRPIDWTLKDDGTDLETFSNSIATYDEGEYIFVGNAWDSNIEVKVTLHKSEIDYIKDMLFEDDDQIKAMREVPTYVTAVFKDGTERIIPDVDVQLVDGRKNVDELIDSETDEPMIDPVTQAPIDYNASVVINGETYKFTIEFEKEEISLDTLTLNAYDYLDKIDALEASGVIRVKVNDSFYRNLPATFDFEEIKAKERTEVQAADKYSVNVRVGAGTIYERDMVLNVEFTPFTIYYIERQVEGAQIADYSKGETNELNYIVTDFIENSQGKSFPTELTVVGFNGKEWIRYTTTARWITDTVKIDLKGGQYFASAILNEGKYNEWRMEGIEVEVLSTDIVALSNSNKTVTFDWKYYFYGNVPLDRCYPTLLNFRTSNGTIKRDVPVTIDFTAFLSDSAKIGEAMLNGITVECPIYVDVEGVELEEELTIQVIVPSIKMALIEDEIEIDYNEYLANGKSAFFKDKMEILLGEDTVMANVTWFTDEVTFNEDGTYTAIVYIAQDTAYEQSCEVTVKITGATQNVEEEA